MATSHNDHECAHEALAVLAAVGRPVPRTIVEARIGAGLARECLAHGIRDEAGGLRFSSEAHGTRTAAVSRAAALLLAESFAHDPWALARAACLHLEAITLDPGAQAAAQALEGALAAATDPAARRDVLRALDAQLESAPAPDAFLLGAITRALDLSESGLALGWLRKLHEQSARRSLLQGRAFHATGDLVAAKVALDEARRLDADGLQKGALAAAIAADLAELACARGELDLARTEADAVLTTSPSHELQLRARNVIGKILLARSEWEAADRHFAEDSLLAANQGLATAEMRADLNRGIALLSRGRIDDADRQFVRVLDAADRQHDPLAAAYALPNLAITALRKHEYGRALGLWERASKTLLGLQSRLPALRALVSTNLAEMRTRLGLLDQAGHVLAFARRNGTAELPSVASRIDVTDAALHLRRGDTAGARRLATQALVEANRVSERAAAHMALRTLRA